MQMTRFALFAACAVIGALATPALRSAPVAATGPLVPLSERDKSAVTGSGCVGVFAIGRREYFQVTGGGMLFRDRSGVKKCPITEDRSDAYNNSFGTLACAGYRLTVRKTGRTADASGNPEADGSMTPVTLTVAKGRASTVLRGSWGVGC